MVNRQSCSSPGLNRLTTNVLLQGREMVHWSKVQDATRRSVTTVSNLFQQQIESSKNKLITSGPKKDEFDRAGTLLCIHCNIAFATTSSPAYKHLMMKVSGGTYDGACYTTNIKHLSLLADEGKDMARQKMRSIIDEVESSPTRVLTFEAGRYTGAQAKFSTLSPLSVGLDIWTEPSSGTSLLAVQGRHIDDSWALSTFLVGCVNVAKKSHTGELLQQKVTGLLEDYGAPVDTKGECEIIMVKVADNASNNKKAFKTDKLNGCVCHTFELSTLAFAKQSAVSAVTQKCQRVVAHFHMSQKGMQELKKLGDALGLKVNKFVQNVSTRFYSNLESMASLLDNRLPLLEYDAGVYAGKPGYGTDAYKEVMLTKRDWTMVEEIVACLQAVGDISKQLEGDGVTISKVLPSLFVIIRKFKSDVIQVRKRKLEGGFEFATVSAEDFSEAVNDARKAFLDDFNQRWIHDLPIESLKIYLLASKLDPCTKKCAFFSHGVFPDEWKQIMDEAIESALTSRTVEDDESDERLGDEDSYSESGDVERTESKVSEDGMHIDIMSMVQEMDVEARTPDKRQSENQRPDPPSIHDEFKAYDLLPQILESKHDPLQWWKEHEKSFPRIASLAREYLAVPASSAGVERFFSSVGLVKSDNRPLKDETTIDIMWAKNVRE